MSPSASAPQRSSDHKDEPSTSPTTTPDTPAATVIDAKATESSQEDAYDPETGEINWDCPCLENMTKPPCGDSFKAAFSCFVYSKEEPKGSDCLEQFREMQKCFRDHPDIYGAELEDDDDDEEDEDEEEKEERKGDEKKEEQASASR
ncbi:uncharacterized protein EV422DRAFT_534734 [Fimicolochytrium jonesii]|uniref:uncharacterized protein n=1 Tax=Fimicolochytrium jonesii TaxID=1396493 RepID=UPI0022FDDAF0|nr:uncharacterized protein EV422DRAFT_534734 [Fimicolochytrium jonesii]KAI8819434.1 hypothetical protein EV422DRAFT_534734 [Fimicolochytrium jonesii]